LADVGPNLGAINRSALIGTDYVVIPLAADLFSLQGLRNLGPTPTSWRQDWERRVQNWTNAEFDHPDGSMKVIGYTIMQHTDRLSRPVKSYEKWVQRIPPTYRESLLTGEAPQPFDGADPYCLARLKHYRSLAPMAQESRKPIFHLTNADGAIGSHAAAVTDARADFKHLATVILQHIGVQVPARTSRPARPGGEPISWPAFLKTPPPP
jgi:chromosome partitioning protein